MLLLTTVALAAGPPAPEPPEGLSWEAVDRRSQAVYQVATTTSAVGLGVTFLGIALESRPVTIAGLALEVPGAPVMAASGLRSARSIRARGGRVTSAGSVLAWAFWAGGLGLLTRAEVVAREPTPDETVVTLTRFAAGGLHLLAFTGGGAQGFSNRRARYELPRRQVSVAPMLTTPGLVVAVGPR